MLPAAANINGSAVQAVGKTFTEFPKAAGGYMALLSLSTCGPTMSLESLGSFDASYMAMDDSNSAFRLRPV